MALQTSTLVSATVSFLNGAVTVAEAAGQQQNETGLESKEHWLVECAKSYHTLATIAIIVFFIVSLPGNTFVVWIYGQQVTRTSYAFYVLVIASIDLMFTVVVVPCTLFLRISNYLPFNKFYVQEVFYHSPKDMCQIFTVFLLIFIAEERIKIFSNPFRPITKAAQGLMRIGCVLTVALCLFVPPVLLAYYQLAWHLKLFTKLLQPLVLIVAATILFCLNVRVVLYATRSKSERNELQKDIRAAKSRCRRENRGSGPNQRGLGGGKSGSSGGSLVTGTTANGAAGGSSSTSAQGIEMAPIRENKQSFASQNRRRLSNLEEDAKMVIALIVTSLVTCGFCLVKMQLIIEFILDKNNLFIVHGCWSYYLLQDFIPHALAYTNYVMSPIVYYVISKRFREDVSRTVRIIRDCNISEPKAKTITITDCSTRSNNKISNSLASAISIV
ncbi:uncharacterized protein LOC134844649 [Symsagittifera roscoffensis]|uniref:uncharacterized protein LOC134844649 n=1 Tax=Symsagittifera roscoffensis TaxID=84072 RepID=UPI00307B919E